MRVTESDVQTAILECLSDGKVWTNAELKKEVRKMLPLSSADKVRANKRTNEEKWENQVNNALSPSRSNSLHAKGCVTSAGHGEHKITEEGLKQWKQYKELLDFVAGLMVTSS